MKIKDKEFIGFIMVLGAVFFSLGFFIGEMVGNIRCLNERIFFKPTIRLNTTETIDLIYAFCNEKLRNSYYAVLHRFCRIPDECWTEIVCYAKKGEWSRAKSFNISEFEKWVRTLEVSSEVME